MGVVSGVNSMISANSTVEISYLSPCQVGRGFFRKESIKNMFGGEKGRKGRLRGLRSIRRIFAEFQERFVRDCVGIEELAPFGNVGQRPLPEGANDQVFGNAAFRFTGGLSDDHFTGDTLSQGKHSQEVLVEKHTVTKVTDFFVHIKGLGSHINLDVVMTLEFEEVTDTGLTS